MKKLNFLSQFSDALLVGLLCILVPAMFSFGYYYGLNHVDKQIAEVRIQNSEMRDSIDMYRNREIAWRNSMNTSVSPQSVSIVK
ncbi:MAG: hypothetical protein FGM61_05435 [Sediminibacterium sp.]|nr:hypothetical protein [Sediminibacterium sp.]